MNKESKIERNLDLIGQKVRSKWFLRKFSKFGATPTKDGYIEYTPSLIDTQNMPEDSQIKFEKILEAELYNRNIKMKRINGRLKGFWIKF